MPLGIVGTIIFWYGKFQPKRLYKSNQWPALEPLVDTLIKQPIEKSQTCLSVNNLTVRFGGLVANNNISENIQTGSIHAIIGPNGAGKSTFLNCISGLYKATDGSIIFGNKNISGLPMHTLAKMGIARTFQNTELFGQMTVLENVLVGFHTKYKSGLLATIARWPTFTKEENHFHILANSLLRYVGLDDYAHEEARNLPFGHQRRLEIARALAISPKVLLLDEPAAGLTHTEIEDLKRLINSLSEKNITIVLVEHHVEMIMALSNTVTVLDYGIVIASGAPDEVQENPMVIEAYFGSKGVTNA
jgi:ABC-type branched-subunit amino acid transport system ATPase component